MTLTPTQRAALKAMSDRDIGAMFTPSHGWTWPETVRNDPTAAASVLHVLAADVVK